ncbi:DUF7287 family protein [Haloarcula salinisoli]|uniref:Uncharacterized protein n=1 Tax=Haloarcula salinisoli TaxID=2487746 RepID=A0A8J8C7R9_9EURY|nr:hypothetical protein [Halomicroarcula salinisoli]MBX0303656.1 hypothetical protein [Halomicroarcula salinisoli]
MSVFLAVLLFIFLFIPGILAPFTASAQDETVTSNRVADQLSKGALAEPGEPYVLDSYCTEAFFNGSSPSDCRFSSGSLRTQLGLSSGYQQVNVSLRGNLTAGGDGQEALCWDSTEPDTGLVESSDGSCDTVLERGNPVPTSQPSVTSVRVVTIDGEDVTLFVEMW